MITEKDLTEAILECQGKRNPDASTCIKLAAFYTIKEHLFPDAAPVAETPQMYSFAAGPEEPEPAWINYQSGTDFSRLIDGRDPYQIWPIIDELVSAVQLTQPRLYNSFLRKLE